MRLKSSFPRARANPCFFGDLPYRIAQYLQGRRTDFLDRLDFPPSSPLRKAIWRMTRTIPYSETRSYSWVAAQAGSPLAGRAVGQAMAANPWPIVVPCHRVIGSDGTLRGFAGGLDMKLRLLELEAGY
ncbi:MAG: MGMT family protein [Chloroflexota bacterium]